MTLIKPIAYLLFVTTLAYLQGKDIDIMILLAKVDFDQGEFNSAISKLNHAVSLQDCGTI